MGMVLLNVLADRGSTECCTLSSFLHMSKIYPDFCWLTLLKPDENMLITVAPLIVSLCADVVDEKGGE